MTGALQTHARRYQLPIDQLNFSFIVKAMDGPEDVADPPNDGMFISGLYLEAGRWDKRKKKLQVTKTHTLKPIIGLISTQ